MQTLQQKREYTVAVLDPAGNVTAIVCSDVPAAERARVAAQILRLPELGIEQVAFLTAPRSGGEIRLEMMGGEFCGNALRCVGKYLYDKRIVKKEYMTIETAGGIKSLLLYTRNGKANTISVGMGKADLDAMSLPTALPGSTIINRPVEIAGGTYHITCASVGNPHCVVFCDDPSALDLETLGPKFERASYFPERINTEFVRIVNEDTLRMRVYERGNGETVACGTGACAAVIAATENGFVEKGKDITVKLVGGDLVVKYTDHEVILTGDAVLVYEGVVEY